MSTQFEIKLKFQTYYNERIALSVTADSQDEAIVAAKTHAKEHWNDGTLDKALESLTKKPRFNVESCEVTGEQSDVPADGEAGSDAPYADDECGDDGVPDAPVDAVDEPLEA